MNIDERAQRFAEILLSNGQEDHALIASVSYELARRMCEELHKNAQELDWDELIGFKVDWSKAPVDAVSWCKSKKGYYYWLNHNGYNIGDSQSFGYIGDYKDSLRKRPE